MRNWCSGVVTAIVAGTVAVWLAMPVIDSMHAGTRDQVSTESQAMIVYLAAGLVLLAVCRWVDDGRRIWRVGLLVCLVVSNALVRVIMSPVCSGWSRYSSCPSWSEYRPGHRQDSSWGPDPACSPACSLIQSQHHCPGRCWRGV